METILSIRVLQGESIAKTPSTDERPAVYPVDLYPEHLRFARACLVPKRGVGLVSEHTRGVPLRRHPGFLSNIHKKRMEKFLSPANRLHHHAFQLWFGIRGRLDSLLEALGG